MVSFTTIIWEIKRGCCGELTCLTLAVFSQSKDICSSGVTCLVMSRSQEGTLFSFGLPKLKLGIYKINMYRCSKTSILGGEDEEEGGRREWGGRGKKKRKANRERHISKWVRVGGYWSSSCVFSEKLICFWEGCRSSVYVSMWLWVCLASGGGAWITYCFFWLNRVTYS